MLVLGRAPFPRRFSRREVLAAARDGVSIAVAAMTIGDGWVSHSAMASSGSSLGFSQPDRTISPTDAVASGYKADVLIRWGDRISDRGAAFDPDKLRAADQEWQFGYNNDFIAFMSLPRDSGNSKRGLLCVNHEYTKNTLMWSIADLADEKPAPERVAYEMAAHGHSVVEVAQSDGQWRVVLDSEYARRLNANSPMLITGPAAGHRRLRTNADPLGLHIYGTINNCAGGKTPWGTVLIAEENFDDYFGGKPDGLPQEEHYRRYGIEGSPRYDWYKHEARFDISYEPNESNRFGWIVELDPYDPTSTPIKRTALGRFKHEGASVWVGGKGKVVLYSGDDEAFQYLYRFVSSERIDSKAAISSRTLLDDGVLFAARFDDDGFLEWLPLIHGQGPLTKKNGFADQGEVLVETRRAAKLLGATPLDRPEDVAVNPDSGYVYVAFTNNKNRKVDEVDAISPRAPNLYGGIVELIPPANDHSAGRYRWQFLLQGGNPEVPEHGAKYHPDTDQSGWLVAPDNLAIDAAGRLWVATDQGWAQHKNGIPDGLYACDLGGPSRALTKFFYRCPVGAEMCGPEFTPDCRTLFVAVQHPGDGIGATFENPATRWPDFQKNTPPRPSVVAITKCDNGVIGS